jgi:hypothetical protein
VSCTPPTQTATTCTCPPIYLAPQLVDAVGTRDMDPMRQAWRASLEDESQQMVWLLQVGGGPAPGSSQPGGSLCTARAPAF